MQKQTALIKKIKSICVFYLLVLFFIVVVIFTAHAASPTEGILHLDFEEGAGRIAHDSSGMGNNAALGENMTDN